MLKVFFWLYNLCDETQIEKMLLERRVRRKIFIGSWEKNDIYQQRKKS
jgi:hypothetical protein